MRLAALVGTVLLGALGACSEDPPALPAPKAAPAASSDGSSPGGTVSNDYTTPGANGTNARNTTGTDTKTPGTTPGQTVLNTCEGLAAAAPAGTLTVTAVHGGFPITPTDVYATVGDDGLSIVLTSTNHECDYRANSFRHAQVNELAINAPSGSAAVGTYASQKLTSESGSVCTSGIGSGGASMNGGSTTGNIVITAADATSVTGTIDVTDFDNQHTTFTFTAPICGAAPASPTCCD